MVFIPKRSKAKAAARSKAGRKQVEKPVDPEIARRRKEQDKAKQLRKRKHAEQRKYKAPSVRITRRRRLDTEEAVARAAIEKLDLSEAFSIKKHELHYVEKAIQLLQHEQTSIWRAFDAVQAARHSNAIDSVCAILRQLHETMEHRQVEREEKEELEPDPNKDWVSTFFGSMSDDELQMQYGVERDQLLDGMGIQLSALHNPLGIPDWIIDADRSELVRVHGRKEKRSE